jgi:hypothetical protein
MPLALAGVCLALAGCATTRPVAYSGLASSARLEPSQDGESARIPYEYSPEVNWSEYANVVVDPVAIYRGKDHQFEKISEADKKVLARYMQEQFRDRLRSRYDLVRDPKPETLRIKLTLTGAKPTTPVIGTLLRFDVAGGVYNAVQSSQGKEGAMTGSVSYAVEIYDASTQRLLCAYVAKQYPNAYNVKATLGAWDAARTGIEKGADELLTRLN